LPLRLFPDTWQSALRKEFKKSDEHLIPLNVEGGPDSEWMSVDDNTPTHLASLRRDALAPGSRRCGKTVAWWRGFIERQRG